MTLLSLTTLSRPIVATAGAVTALLRRAWFRRNRSESTTSTDSDSYTNQIIATKRSSLRHKCDAASGDSDLDVGSDIHGLDDDVLCTDDDLSNEAYLAMLQLEIVPLDQEALFDGLHNHGLRGRMLDADSKRSKAGNLVTFSFRGCEVTVLPEYIYSEGKNVAALIARENRLCAVDARLAMLVNLRVLDLSDNNLSALPEALCKLTNLHALDISRNQFHEIPSAVTSLPALRVLYVAGLHLQSLPSALQDLQSLVELHCNDNDIADFTVVLLMMRSLQTLNLSKNRLTFVPSEVVETMPRLRHLILSDNPIERDAWMEADQGKLHLYL